MAPLWLAWNCSAGLAGWQERLHYYQAILDRWVSSLEYLHSKGATRPLLAACSIVQTVLRVIKFLLTCRLMFPRCSISLLLALLSFTNENNWSSSLFLLCPFTYFQPAIMSPICHLCSSLNMSGSLGCFLRGPVSYAFHHFCFSPLNSL